MRRLVLGVIALLLPAVAQAQILANTNGSASFTVYAVDANSNPQPYADLSLRVVSLPISGGHVHPLQSGGITMRMGTLNTTSCTTGWNGAQCNVTFNTGNFGGEAQIEVTVLTGPQAGQVFMSHPPIYVSSIGGGDISLSLENYASPYFSTIGQTTEHPDNHYCMPDFCDDVVQLATDYYAAHSLTLAYNDASLIKGGLFDVNDNWWTPHNEHRLGRNLDVRANSLPNAIPNDPAIRAWFVSRCIQLFGQAPLHEDAGGANEHYHIRG